MESTDSGSVSYKQTKAPPKTLVDLIHLYLPLDDGYKSVAKATDDEFLGFIKKFIKIDFEEGATSNWTPEERLEVIQLALDRKPTFTIYRKEPANGR